MMVIELLVIFLLFGITLYPILLLCINGHSKDNKKITIILYFLIILVHSAISIWNGFYGPIFGADRDALEFHNAAISFINENDISYLFIPGWVYSIFLGIIYLLSVESWAIGCMLSTVCFAFLIYISIQIYEAIINATHKRDGIKDLYPFKILLFLGLIPSSILLTSITLREVYQMFFLSAALLFSIRHLQKGGAKNIFWMVFYLFALTSLHGSLIYYACIYLLIFILFRFRDVKIINKNSIGSIFLVFAAFLFIMDFDLLYELINKFIQGTEGSEDARAYYGFPSLSANLFSIISFIGISFVNYMIRPFPWEISNIVDVTTLFENALRLFFIWKMFFLKRFMSPSLVWVIIAALLLEVMWGMGTLNWGTAQRHHLIAWPLFVVAYYAAKMLKIKINNRII
jgi:hypothetical protein